MIDVQVAPALFDTAVRRATLVGLDVEEGSHVCLLTGPPEEVTCDVLHSAGAYPRLFPGDAVLVWQPAPGARGVILGRIGPSHAPPDSEPEDDLPDELVIEAKKNLTLKCGDGSITIREDGKILIKGRDLVSHAQRLNRIRGGAVSIN